MPDDGMRFLFRGRTRQEMLHSLAKVLAFEARLPSLQQYGFPRGNQVLASPHAAEATRLFACANPSEAILPAGKQNVVLSLLRCPGKAGCGNLTK